MEIPLIAKGCLVFQKKYLNNLFDILFLYQVVAEKSKWYWACRLGADPSLEFTAEQCLKMMRKGREETKTVINKGHERIENCLEEMVLKDKSE